LLRGGRDGEQQYGGEGESFEHRRILAAKRLAIHRANTLEN
jgi:hypothetical protein